ncbi:MAG TPA: hypothetical protein PK743_13540 [Luteimonas sp.]|nr:hypothetical protein [Luteimonas sp.]
MLEARQPGHGRRRIGLVIAMSLAAAISFAAWVAQPAREGAPADQAGAADDTHRAQGIWLLEDGKSVNILAINMLAIDVLDQYARATGQSLQIADDVSRDKRITLDFTAVPGFTLEALIAEVMGARIESDGVTLRVQALSSAGQ